MIFGSRTGKTLPKRAHPVEIGSDQASAFRVLVFVCFALNACSHDLSPNVSLARLRSANITNTEVKPSQSCGSPYFPLIGPRFSRWFHWSKVAELLRPLHLAHAVQRFLHYTGLLSKMLPHDLLPRRVHLKEELRAASSVRDNRPGADHPRCFSLPVPTTS